MTAQLDPYEIYTDETQDDEWDLGPACSIEDAECEACQ
jgi:hypothetical protein